MPRVGKKFAKAAHNDILHTILEDTRLKIIQIGIKEKNNMIVNAQVELCHIYADMQQLPFAKYKKLKSKADKVENSLIVNLEKNMERKVNVFKSSRRRPNGIDEMPSPATIHHHQLPCATI